jgi:hypothetical protein
MSWWYIVEQEHGNCIDIVTVLLNEISLNQHSLIDIYRMLRKKGNSDHKMNLNN